MHRSLVVFTGLATLASLSGCMSPVMRVYHYGDRSGAYDLLRDLDPYPAQDLGLLPYGQGPSAVPDVELADRLSAPGRSIAVYGRLTRHLSDPESDVAPRTLLLNLWAFDLEGELLRYQSVPVREELPTQSNPPPMLVTSPTKKQVLVLDRAHGELLALAWNGTEFVRVEESGD